MDFVQGGGRQPMIDGKIISAIDEQKAKRLGNIYPSGGENGNIYDTTSISPTLKAGTGVSGNGIGSCNAPKIITNVRQANITESGILQRPRGKNKGGYHDVCPTITNDTFCHNNLVAESSIDRTIVRMCGRNPDNPSDRTKGAYLEQRLEPNSQGICGTLTSVQKDNLVMETVRIKQATAQGYIECEVGGVADFSYPSSKTRRGRVQDKGQVSPTIMAGESDVCRIETYSPYVNERYSEFIKENGYVPEYFNPYNKTELHDVAPTLTAQGESVTKSSTVLKCNTQYRIRKLTPLECWRLMSFSDEDFLAAKVGGRDAAKDLLATYPNHHGKRMMSEAERISKMSNTQLYKQAGNSIVKNVLIAIFGQMIDGKEDIYKCV